MELLHFISQFRSDTGNLIFQAITWMAQEPVVIAIICWLFWCANKKLAYTLGFTYFTSGILVQGLKITFRIPRPWVLDPDFEAVASALPDATGYSFPSGHTQSVTALFGVIGLHVRRILRILCFAIIFLVGFSRMYLGCHTLKDVLTSFVLSSVCVYFCYSFFYKKDLLEKNVRLTAIIFSCVSILLAIYSCILNASGMIELEYAQDCLKASGAGVAFAVGYYIEVTHLNFCTEAAFSTKLIRFLIGLFVALLLQIGLKPVLGTSLFACFMRYFLVVLWIIAIYPFLFSRKIRKL